MWKPYDKFLAYIRFEDDIVEQGSDQWQNAIQFTFKYRSRNLLCISKHK